jgi:regulator of CtrA degradation
MVREELASVSSCVMNTKTEIKDDTSSHPVTISFGERFAASDLFDAIFKEGMALVERTASYLDGPGRKEARLLRGPVSVLYATESMRLTTRLLELASWLMIRRALKAGEISNEEAQVKRDRVRLRAPGRPSHVKGFTELPEGLRTLIEASFALNDRIVQLDRAMQVVVGQAPSITSNPVEAQMLRIEEAFANPQRRRASGE